MDALLLLINKNLQEDIQPHHITSIPSLPLLFVEISQTEEAKDIVEDED